MNQQTAAFDKMSTIVAASLLSAAAVMFFNAQPVIMGVATDSMSLSPAQMGALASAEIGGIGLASIAAVFLLQRINWQFTVCTGLVVMVLGNIASIYLDQFVPLAITRFLTGLFGEGVVFALAYAILGETKDTDRAFALSIVAQVGFGMLGLWGFPYIAEPWGYEGVIVSLALISALCILLLPWIPRHGLKVSLTQEHAATDVSSPLMPIFLGLAVIVLWFTGLSGVWAFIERAGIVTGLAQAEVGGILSIGMGLGVVGALLASWAGDRYGRFWPPALSLVAHAVLSIILVNSQAAGPYIVAVMLFTFIWNFGLPYLLGLVASADMSGRFVVLLIAATAVGNTLGPSIAGAIASPESLSWIGYVASGFCVISLLVYTIFTRSLKSLAFP